ncbi:hypothetical protein BKA69DRAFT_61801 [Paraphysoderma sedebokerense]|nr:hypothetical protein BKA69DRAFT_61801 [Paraphysoderma sedebokerense]
MLKKISLSLVYLWICVFFFPMIHDLFHEVGHGAHAVASCGATAVSISLGDYKYCPPSSSIWTFCVQPGWFYKSLYRQSVTFYSGARSPSCSKQLLNASGGIMGIFMSYILLFVVTSLVWRVFLRRPLRQAVTVGATFLFVPFKWLSRLDLSLASHVVVAFGAMVIQWDVINDFFYSFFPSRLVIWLFLEFGDGTWLWRNGGHSEDSILNVSYVVFVVLVLIYLYTFYSFYQHIKRIRARARSGESKSDNV